MQQMIFCNVTFQWLLLTFFWPLAWSKLTALRKNWGRKCSRTWMFFFFSPLEVFVSLWYSHNSARCKADYWERIFCATSDFHFLKISFDIKFLFCSLCLPQDSLPRVQQPPQPHSARPHLTLQPIITMHVQLVTNYKFIVCGYWQTHNWFILFFFHILHKSYDNCNCFIYLTYHNIVIIQLSHIISITIMITKITMITITIMTLWELMALHQDSWPQNCAIWRLCPTLEEDRCISKEILNVLNKTTQTSANHTNAHQHT